MKSSTWTQIGDLYSHLDANTFEISMDSLLDGSLITQTGDSLKAQLSKMKPYVRSKTSEIRKKGAERLRDAAERFCKELLVKEKNKLGEKVDVTTFTNKTLEELSEMCEKFYTDPSHAGKLRQVRRNTNPGNHDDEIPNQSELWHAYRELCKFEKDYISGG